MRAKERVRIATTAEEIVWQDYRAVAGWPCIPCRDQLPTDGGVMEHGSDKRIALQEQRFDTGEVEINYAEGPAADPSFWPRI